MANFSVWDDEDDYGGLFITQSSSLDNCVSLEEDNEGEFVSVRDPQYSDISDVEEESKGEKQLR